MQYSTLQTTIEHDLVGVLPLEDPEMVEDLRRNLDDMLTLAGQYYSGGAPRSADPDPAHLASGELHAARMQHPADALRAADLIFDAALPAFIAEVGALTTAEIIRATRALHSAIWGRFPAGAVAYTETLRQRASAAHIDARAQVARELHDRVSHSILAGIQRVQIPEMAAEGVELLREALRDIQSIAVALHARVGDSTLDVAFARTASSLVPEDRIRIESVGTPAFLPAWSGEEALTILVEALMNARKHTSDAAIDVRFAWTADQLVASVSDDGPGFDLTTVRAGGLGLRTMQERADLIGARLDIVSEPGEGTAVIVTVPIAA